MEEATRKAQRKNEIDNIALEMIQKNANRNMHGNRRAELFKEVMGDGN